MSKLKTWHLEALTQATFYACVVYAQRGTLQCADSALAMGLYCFGRLASIANRQEEMWRKHRIRELIVSYEVSCARQAWRYALASRLCILAFAWHVRAWLTIADLFWGVVLYPTWRFLYRKVQARFA